MPKLLLLRTLKFVSDAFGAKTVKQRTTHEVCVESGAGEIVVFKG